MYDILAAGDRRCFAPPCRNTCSIHHIVRFKGIILDNTLVPKLTYMTPLLEESKLCDCFAEERGTEKKKFNAKKLYVFITNVYLMCALCRIEAANILGIFPVPSISHQVVFRKITQGLANRGHNVTVITPDPAYKNGEAPPNYHEIDVHDISYAVIRKFYKQKAHVFGDVMTFTDIRGSFEFMKEIFQAQLETEEVQKLISRKTKFDLILIESVIRLDYLNQEEENSFLKEIFGPQCPSLNEMNKNVDMLLLNIHPMWVDNQPVASNVIYMGGIHQLSEKKLPQELQKYLDSSKNGVIYVSFGTNVLSQVFPEDKLKIIINVVSRLPYDILWKWDKDELPIKASNIKLSKWLPQSDLLRHKNVKLFITQAGLQSTDEAITAGVPLVAIPMLGDQWFNAEKYEKFGIGIKLDVKTLTTDQLSKAIETVISDESYRHNISKLRGLMHDQPEPPLNRTMWWIEYVLRHGGAKHLRSAGANMSYWEYFETELILVILLGIFIIVAGISVVGFMLTHFISKFFTTTRKLKTN
ncbi:UDP-glycosyltransferase UGT33B7 [Danaus plexippus plexippus]|uniref:UDP-glucuronosyltransferase n=1 Tax=Danaus plexippus plexippus TaxID=278856 RepID=A0A212FLF2_DANPL|nr:UDP-glycosyltransferase UGT33B7 [Danaus plexippus plexippus]